MRRACRGNSSTRTVPSYSAYTPKVRDIDIPLGRIAAVYPKEDTNKVSYFPILETPADFGRAEKPDDSDDDIPTFTKL